MVTLPSEKDFLHLLLFPYEFEGFIIHFILIELVLLLPFLAPFIHIFYSPISRLFIFRSKAVT